MSRGGPVGGWQKVPYLAGGLATQDECQYGCQGNY